MEHRGQWEVVKENCPNGVGVTTVMDKIDLDYNSKV